MAKRKTKTVAKKTKTSKKTKKVTSKKSAKPAKKVESPKKNTIQEEDIIDNSVELSIEEERRNEELLLNQRVSEFKDEPNILVTKLSRALKKKIVTKAKSEGLSVSDFVEELLAEGVILRAWEIMERKAAMKSEGNRVSSKNHINSPSMNHRNNNNHGHQRRHQHNRGRQQSGVMEDSAAFREYVRNQEHR